MAGDAFYLSPVFVRLLISSFQSLVNTMHLFGGRKGSGAAVGHLLRRSPSRPAPTAPHPGLMAQAEFRDQSTIAVRAFLAEICKQPSALTNHHEQAAARMEIMLMDFKVFRELIDAPGQDRDLDFWRSCISFVNAGIFNDF